jgi:hypothetical protein
VAGTGIEQEVIAAFVDDLRQSEEEEEVPAELISELASHLTMGGPDARAIVEMVTRLAGDSSA